MLLATNGTGYRVAAAAQIKSLFSGNVRNAGGNESQLLSCSVLSSAAEEYLTCNDN